MPESNSSRTAVAAIVAGAAMISFSPVFVKIAGVGPTTAGLYRTFFGGVCLLMFVALGRRRLWAGARPMALAVACGALFAVDLSFWHRSILHVGPGLATILGNVQVFFLAGFGILVLREKPDWKRLVSIPLAMTGLIMLVGTDWSDLDSGFKLGVLYGIGTALAYAAFLLVLRTSRSGAPKVDPAANLCVISLVTALIMGIEGWLQGESLAIPDRTAWLSLLAYGVLCQAVAWIIISRAVAKVEVSRAGLVLLLQPTLAFVWDVVFFSRPTGVMDGAGAALALVAIYLGAGGARK
jgi:drug/metabolite transporter (DMT)-like permease